MRMSTSLLHQRATTAMLDQQSKVAKTELQLATGKRILTPSDDPVGATRVMELSRAIETVKQYQGNIEYVSARLEKEDDVLGSVVNLLQRTNDLAIRGNTATMNSADRDIIANELHGLLDGLIDLANTKDTNGEYIFAGFQRDSEPFTRTALDTIVYGGDQGQRSLQISATGQVVDGDNGFDLFVDIETSPYVSVAGVAATSLAAINDGELTINGLSVGAIPAAANAAERALQVRDAINTITTVTDVQAKIVGGDTVTLTSTAGNIDVVAASTPDTGLTTGTYTPTAPSHRNVFETIYQLATELESDNSVDRYIADIQQALDRVIDTRATVGSRLNRVDSQTEVNTGSQLIMETYRSEQEDLDYTEAISQLNQQMMSLQAAQQAYVKVQGLTLFNYL